MQVLHMLSNAQVCPTPFNKPAVASERCASSPQSDIHELQMYSSRTRILVKKKSAELAENSSHNVVLDNFPSQNNGLTFFSNVMQYFVDYIILLV